MWGEGPGRNCCVINYNNNDNKGNVLSFPSVFIASVVQSYRLVWCQYCHFVPLSNERRERWYLPPASGSLISLVSSPGQQLERRDLQGKVKAADCICAHICTCICTFICICIRVCLFQLEKASLFWTLWLLPLDQYFT